MRWIWIDRILELEPGRRCVALKSISAGEDAVHDHAADAAGKPMLPPTLVIEGMAQTAGILVGHAGRFRENVILAKIARATFARDAEAGYCIRYTATLERYDASGAATAGLCELIDPATAADAATTTAGAGAAPLAPLAEIDLIFSHVAAGRGRRGLPRHNFVFHGEFMNLLERSGFAVDNAPHVSATPGRGGDFTIDSR